MIDFRDFVEEAGEDDASSSSKFVNANNTSTPESTPPITPTQSMWSTVESGSSVEAAPKIPKPVAAKKTGASVKAAAQPSAEMPAVNGSSTKFPVGWLLVTGGPGLGTCLTLHSGSSRIFRDSSGIIFLGSDEVKTPVATITYQPESNTFSAGGGSGAGQTEVLEDGATMNIGKSEIRFVALCSDTFQWPNSAGES